ncbi:MAG: SCO family protein [Candidatus Omnitrophica bacterium]|nr:SCO family protein [Candidatus Omnitrophota bacterium]
MRWISPVLGLVLGLLALVLVLSPSRIRPPAQTASTAKLPHLGIVPDFSLVDQEGRLVNRAALLGSVWVADFIFTRCAGQCPLISQRMKTLQVVLHDAPQVRFVSFSVDPQYDSPAVLAKYAADYTDDQKRWLFLTGDPQAIRKLVQEGFRLAMGQEGTDAEPITHSGRLVLVDAQGSIRGTYEAAETQAMDRLLNDVRQLAAF